jgi:hypothetical protein
VQLLGLSLCKKNFGLGGSVVDVVFEDEHFFSEGTDSSLRVQAAGPEIRKEPVRRRITS